MNAFEKTGMLGKLRRVRMPQPAIMGNAPPLAVALGGVHELIRVEGSITTGKGPRRPRRAAWGNTRERRRNRGSARKVRQRRQRAQTLPRKMDRPARGLAGWAWLGSATGLFLIPAHVVPVGLRGFVQVRPGVRPTSSDGAAESPRARIDRGRESAGGPDNVERPACHLV